jgi:hypothetical protein
MSRELCRALIVSAAWAVPAPAAASPAIVAADIRVIVSSPSSCEVTMALRVDGTTEVEHPIEAFGDAVAHLDEVQGAQVLTGPRRSGRTQMVALQLQQPDYELRYRFVQNSERLGRCPVWVPAIPSTGTLGSIRISVRLPDESQPGASMPALTWSGSVGSTALAHVPAFVRVSYSARGAAVTWDVARVMDGLAVAVFAVASLMWLWRRGRRRWA